MAASTTATSTSTMAGGDLSATSRANGASPPTSAHGTAAAASTTALSNGSGKGQSAAGNTTNSTEVWSSLLNSVASSRLVPTKDVIIFGDPHSGKSTLMERIKTALPTPSSDALANGVDGAKAVNGVVLPTGPNGVGNASSGSAPVMVEMGTSTGEDHLFADGQKKNDLALSYSFWNIEDDENEDTLARLGIYQMAGSNKSYHPLLKYCLNTNTTADSAVIIVLDWSKPWTFMETLQRWARVLDVALQQILQEGAVATATWTKGKALLEELQEKLSRFLQEYTEPQPHAANGAVAYSESQTFNLGSTDAQSVLLPLTEGCLTNNTGLPLVIVCTKSDYINNLEREMDYKEETFDYIQQSLRTICLKYGASLFYTSIHHPHTFADLRQYLLHRLLTPSTLSSTHQQQQQQQQQPSSFPFRMRAQVVERDQVMVPAGWDSMGKIKVLRNGFDCEGVAEGWDMDMKNAADGATDAARLESGARQVYEEVIINPKRNLAPVTIQPLITAEEDQVFLEQFLETLQRTASDRTGISAMGGAGMGSRSTAPPVVGPLSSGYTSMLNSHHSSPPPGMSTVPHSVGSAGGRAGANGYDSDEVERLKGFRSQKSSKVNGGIGSGSSTSRLIGPALTEGDIGGGLSSAKYNGRSPPTSGTGSNNSGLSAASLKAGMTAGGAGAGVGGAGTAGVGQRLGGAGVAGTIGGSSVAANQAETAKITSFFQSLMSKNSGAGGAGLGRMGSMTLDGSASPSGGAGAAGGNDA